MKLIHFSDTHLGYGEYSKVDPASGINQRELDINAAFKQVIDLILKKKPDLVIHSGDLFDSARPSNRAIAVALAGLQRLSNAGIPAVLVSGNHSTPRIASSGSIFEALKVFPGLYPVYQRQYETIRIGDTVVHAVPHASSDAELCAELEKVRPDPVAKFNILALHAGLTLDEVYRMGEFNELIVPGKILSRLKDFDYIALGHWHRFLEFKGIPNACYSGSTERLSFRETGYAKGFVWLDLAARKREFCPIEVREMIKLGPIDCEGKDADTVMEAIRKLKKTNQTEGRIIQLKLERLSRSTYVQLDLRQVRALLEDAFQVDILPDLVAEIGGTAVNESAIDALPLEFERFLAGLDLPGADKKMLAKLGASYLTKAQDSEQL